MKHVEEVEGLENRWFWRVRGVAREGDSWVCEAWRGWVIPGGRRAGSPGG